MQSTSECASLTASEVNSVVIKAASIKQTSIFDFLNSYYSFLSTEADSYCAKHVFIKDETEF